MRRGQVGLVIDGPPLAGPNTAFWPVERDGAGVGHVTPAVHSPRLGRNIALAMVGVDHAGLGTEVVVVTGDGRAPATVVERPFHDPRKTLAVA